MTKLGLKSTDIVEDLPDQQWGYLLDWIMIYNNEETRHQFSQKYQNQAVVMSALTQPYVTPSAFR